jgi:hypothetical protein
LEALGAVAYRGSLDEVDGLRDGAAGADGVLHMAFGGDFADPEGLIRRDRNAIEALGQALEGSGKPFVSTSGTLVLAAGRGKGGAGPFLAAGREGVGEGGADLVLVAGREGTEKDVPDADGIAGFRIPGERACLGFGERGVRAGVVRLAPTVHGPGDYGFIGGLVATARRTGVSAYAGDGGNRWPAVHRRDAAVLFRLALEGAPAGSVLHGVAESGVTMRSIAEAIARGLGVPAVSLTPDAAAGHFENPFLATVYGLDAPASGVYTRELLGWSPTHPTLLDDLAHGDYLAPPTS